MALTTTVPVTAEDLLHLPARITFGTWASDWTLFTLQGRKREREREKEGRKEAGREGGREGSRVGWVSWGGVADQKYSNRHTQAASVHSGGQFQRGRRTIKITRAIYCLMIWMNLLCINVSVTTVVCCMKTFPDVKVFLLCYSNQMQTPHQWFSEATVHTFTHRTQALRIKFSCLEVTAENSCWINAINQCISF